MEIRCMAPTVNPTHEMGIPFMVVTVVATAPMGTRLMEAMEAPIAGTEIQPMVVMGPLPAPMGTPRTARTVVAVYEMEIRFTVTELR